MFTWVIPDPVSLCRAEQVAGGSGEWTGHRHGGRALLTKTVEEVGGGGIFQGK